MEWIQNDKFIYWMHPSHRMRWYRTGPVYHPNTVMFERSLGTAVSIMTSIINRLDCYSTYLSRRNQLGGLMMTANYMAGILAFTKWSGIDSRLLGGAVQKPIEAVLCASIRKNAHMWNMQARSSGG